jgi:hypothetical protein
LLDARRYLPFEKQEEIFMPTSIATYTFGSKANDGHANCIQALSNFYEVTAVIVLALLVFETRLGLFDGLSIAQALLKATATDLMLDRFVGIL